MDRTSTGDGIVAALQVLEAMVISGHSLAELSAGMQVLPQKLVNVRLKQRVILSEHPRVMAAVSAVEAQLAGRGRVLLRPSGTEPVIRVMVEGEALGQVEQLAESLAEDVKQILVN
jgi:phosphoglucosamine mutase